MTEVLFFYLTWGGLTILEYTSVDDLSSSSTLRTHEYCAKLVRHVKKKRNANAFSLNGTVDVRRHGAAAVVTKWFFGKISETTSGGNFKNVPTCSPCIHYHSTGNDVTIYFRFAANRTTYLFWVMFGSQILDNRSTDANSFTVLDTVVQGRHFLLCNLLDIFATWPR